MVITWVLLNVEQAGGQAGIESGGLELDVEGEGIVDELLDVERDLRRVDGPIVRESQLDWDIEKRIFVRVDVVSNDGGKTRGVEENFDLAKALRESGGFTGQTNWPLIRTKVGESDPVFGFCAHVSHHGVWGVCEGGEGERRKYTNVG